MVAALFCKLASLLRSRLAAFGPDVRITVRCLQVLVKGIDAKSLVKNCPEFIRTSMLTFFNNVADDLGHTILNLQEGKYAHLRGTHLKTSTSLGTSMAYYCRSHRYVRPPGQLRVRRGLTVVTRRVSFRSLLG
ncbi:hypothetical protein ACJJTC_011445 [Scirpophaga incertulas]